MDFSQVKALMVPVPEGTLPYDSEVEYLESQGNAQIDTGVAISPDIGIEMDFYLPEYTAGNYILGNIPNWSTDRFMVGYSPYSGGVLRFDPYTTTNLSFVKNFGVWQKIVIGDGTVTIDGVVKTYTPSSITTTANLYLFGRGGAGDGYAGLRIKSCKVRVAGQVVRDYVAVRVGTEGCLYDRVSGTLAHKTFGTGDFTYGADTRPTRPELPYDAEVDYLESNGTQYIDTGINGSTPLRFRCDFSLTEGNVANNALFGAFTADNRLMVYIGGVNSAGANIMALGCGTATGQRIGINPKPGERHSILVNFANEDTWVEADGGSRLALEGTTATNTINAYLFARSGNVTTINARIYSATIFNGAGTVVRDFIPVRKNGVGCFYDKVSGQLFGNAGTGTFGSGPDKPESSYPVVSISIGGTTVWTKP